MNKKIKGDFHFHSLHSGCQGEHGIGKLINYKKTCGVASIQEIIKISKLFKNLGYDFLAITNHSSNPVSVKPASDYEMNLMFDHIREIKKLNKSEKCAVKVLAGVEVNIINSRGGLSMPDDVLKKLDIVIASNHRPTEKLSKNNI